MGGRYDIMQRVKEVLEASDPLNYGNAEQSRTIEVGPAPQLSPDPRIEALAHSPYPSPTPPPNPPPATVPPATPTDAAPGQAELVLLLREGRKIMAVKRYRELTGVGLAEAKAVIDALEQRLAADTDHAYAPPPPPPATAPAAPDMDALAARVVGLVQGGNKIEAIKEYRDATNVGLREAKEAVETIAARLHQARQPAPAPPPPPPVGLSGPRQTIPEWLSPVVEQLRRGDKIQAIKAYRAATGVGLAEAKDTVEALERQLASQWRG